ncbi:unnamed protein product [Cyclocybe aegerita]|uniref:CBM1 domain-containing protein n=1 Tax=Cyclocybe aegerita TaxID=1973307 RepID=A0A8S0XF66_CYCAE|nr:unnamed protein product [Cyclocybe aegerita]
MFAIKVFTIILSAFSVTASSIPAKKHADLHWIPTWTNMPQLVEPNNLPPAPFLSSNAVFRDTTLRQTLHMSVGAEKIRIVFSNTFGGSELPITLANVALPIGGRAGVSGILASPIVPITFNGGATSVTIPQGKTITSDELAFPIQPQQMITVTMYLQQGQSGNNIDGHPGSRTTSWMQQGNHATSTTLSGTSVVHWYLLSSVEALVPLDYRSLIVLGDSITDGRGSDNDANNRWPDLLLARLQKNGLTNIAVCNQAAGGNRVLADGLGPSLLSRYKRDALDQPGVKWILIFEGVNDLGTGAANSDTQTQIANRLIAAFEQIAADAKAKGVKVFGATITAFSAPGGASQQGYSDPTREAARQTVNNWILTSGTYDAVIDFDKFLRDPSTPSQLAQQYHGGDYLHPNVAGYQHLADMFPLEIFNDSPPVPTTPGTTLPPVTVVPPPPPSTTTTTASGPTQTRYGQCGGQGYNGPKACASPYTCQVLNDWYSQCL